MSTLFKFFENIYNLSRFTEFTAHGFAERLRLSIFNKTEKDTLDATINLIKTVRKAAQQARYERSHNEIIKNGTTHLHKCWQERFLPLGWN